MKKKRYLSVLGLAMSAVMLFSACGGSDTDSQGSSQDQQSVSDTNKAVITTDGGVTAGTGESKDSIVFVMNSEPASLEPGATSTSDSYSRMVDIQINESLLREKVGDRTTLEPLLCDSYEFSEDGLHINFAIKQGVKFSNGDDMTVEDVAFSINKALGMPNVQEYAQIIDNAEVIDDTHVQINLKYAYSPVLNILCHPAFGIISQKYYEQCEADGTNFGRNPMGTGAYVFESWQNGSNIKLVANENWHKGEVPIKNLEFRFMADATTAAIALESGDCDVFYGVDSTDLPRLRENPDVNVLSVQSSGYYFVALNTEVETLSDVRVRKALSMALDRQEVIDGGQDGVGWVTEIPITPGIFGYQEDFKSDALDVEGAKALLAEAGYPDGFTLQMKVPEAAYYSRPAQVVQEQFRRIGVTVDLQIMERGAFDTDVGNRDYESIYYWIGASYPDAYTIVYKMFNSDYTDTGVATNMAKVKSDEADRIVTEAREAIDPDERMALYRELCELNKENAWYLPILTSTNTLCARADVAGAYGHSAAYYYVSDWGN